MKRWTTTVALALLCAVLGVSGCKDDGGGKKPATMFQAATDSPVVVRGGAMTIRTKETTYGWIMGADVDHYCTNISNLSWFGTDADLQTGTQPSTFPAGSTVQMQGRQFLGVGVGGSAKDSQNGILLTAQSVTCTGTAGFSILLAPMNGSSYSHFYQDEAALNEEGNGKVVRGKRFMDTTATCLGPSPTYNSAPTGDEDTCERGSTITVIVPGAAGGTSTYRCKNGECAVGIGAK